MSRNGSGTYSLNTAGQPVVVGTTITSTAFNAAMADIATALTQSICVDGQTPITANVPMASHKITGLAAATTSGDALAFGANVAWTPIDSSGASLALTVNGAGYTQIGNLVHVWASITFPVTVDGTSIKIGGLPVTAANVNNVGGAFSVLGLSTDMGVIIKNTTTFNILTSAAVARTNASYSAGTFYVAFWYAAS